MEIPQPQNGSRILYWATALTQYLRSQRLLSGSGILVKQTAAGITLSTTPGSGGSAFTGVYWFKGKRYELNINNAKLYWYHNEQSSTGAWSDGPMPSPMPDMMYWRTTAECNAVEYIMC